MPRHRRRSLSFTSDSLHRADTEDDNDYLLDPDQMYDVLPQPYRMINMILTHILDSVYDIAESKENAVLTEARKSRPPRFDESLMLSVSIFLSFIYYIYFHVCHCNRCPCKMDSSVVRAHKPVFCIIVLLEIGCCICLG